MLKHVELWAVTQILALAHLAVPVIPDGDIGPSIYALAQDVAKALRDPTIQTIEIAAKDAFAIAAELKALPIPPEHVADLEKAIDELTSDFVKK